MKNIKQIILLAGLTAALAGSTGCALLLVGGVVAGAAYGTVSYANNALQVTDQVSLDRAWQAADGALKSLSIPVRTTRKDGLSGRMEARTAQNQPVIIKVTRKSDFITQVEVSVGTFDSMDNRAEAQLIYDRMKARY